MDSDKENDGVGENREEDEEDSTTFFEERDDASTTFFEQDEEEGEERRGHDPYESDEDPPVMEDESEEEGGDDEDNINAHVDWDQRFEIPDTTFLPSAAKILFPCTTDSTPLQLGRLFMTDAIVENVCDQTNLYAQQLLEKGAKIPKWTPLTIPEFWRFQGLVWLMGVVKKPTIQDYWSSSPLISTPIFTNTMSRNRFSDILRCLHLVDNSKVSPTEKDRFHKLGSFFPDLLTQFKKAITPGQHLNLDESLLLWKGRLSFRQYNPKKRARFGIKLFYIVDDESKMVLGILAYQGKSTAVSDREWIKIYGFGGACVLTLIQDFKDKNHIVTVDNWFNSPSLASTLLEHRIFILGTVQKKRKGIPKKCRRMTRKLPKGEVEVFSNGSVLIERWSDRREVLMLNSFMDHQMKMVNSSNPKNARLKPATVLEYNKKMGGVDQMDQILKSYSSLRRTYKWYRKVFFRLTETAVYNALCLYNLLPNRRLKLCFKDFLLKLIKEILSEFPDIERRPRGRPSSSLSCPTPIGLHLPERDFTPAGKHRWSRCFYCRTGKHLRRKTRTTQFFCSLCKLNLCIDGPGNCFQKYHEEKYGHKVATTTAHQPSNVAEMIVEPSLGSLWNHHSVIMHTRDLISVAPPNPSIIEAPLMHTQQFIPSQAYLDFNPPVSSTQVIETDMGVVLQNSPVVLFGEEFDDAVKFID